MAMTICAKLAQKGIMDLRPWKFCVSPFRVYLSAGAIGLLLTTGCGRQQPIQAKQDTGPVKVSVVPVSTRTVQRIVESVGTLFPFDEAIISAEIEGRVDQVKVDLGDEVAQGEILVHIS